MKDEKGENRKPNVWMKDERIVFFLYEFYKIDRKKVLYCYYILCKYYSHSHYSKRDLCIIPSFRVYYYDYNHLLTFQIVRLIDALHPNFLLLIRISPPQLPV